MRKLLMAVTLSTLFLFACTKEKDELNDSRATESLLIASNYSSDPNYTFEYDDENRLIKTVINGGNIVNEYSYDTDGDFSGFKQTSQSNAIYPIRRFTVDVNTSTEISGNFNLYDVNDNIDPAQTSHYLYEIDNGLIKTFLQTYPSGEWKKTFEHNSDGNLTAVQMFDNPQSGHLYRIEFTSWDEKPNTNIYASQLQTYPAFDIIPGIKLSNHNMMNQQNLYKDVNCCGVSEFLYEYNDYDQITRIYSLSSDVYNEEGEIEIPGGQEVDFATFDYIVVE